MSCLFLRLLFILIRNIRLYGAIWYSAIDEAHVEIIDNHMLGEMKEVSNQQFLQAQRNPSERTRIMVN